VLASKFSSPVAVLAFQLYNQNLMKFYCSYVIDFEPQIVRSICGFFNGRRIIAIHIIRSRAKATRNN
jgi:hypothetical protein